MLQRARTSLRLRALDARDRYGSFPSRADRLVPPRRRDFVGHSDFVATGEEFLGHFQELAGLRATDRVLDVGCGIGRMARPLTRVLEPPGGYDGFDVNRDAIGWCQRRYPDHFRFEVADLLNARYNPSGRFLAEEYEFPYPDGTFDLAIATSVFTHLLPEAAEHYVAEIARTLKPGGRTLTTWFVLDDTSRALIAAGRSGLPFLDAGDPVALVDEAVPEEAVAYADEWLFETLRRHGLVLTQLHPGSWCGREEHVSFQDLVIAEKES